jgi:hypothetical protein
MSTVQSESLTMTSERRALITLTNSLVAKMEKGEDRRGVRERRVRPTGRTEP